MKFCSVQDQAVLIRGLVWEWNFISDYYDLREQDEFYCPAFSFFNSSSALARWNYSKYEISVDMDFFLNSNWYEIRYVLKHEIAHQYADTCLGGRSEPPHGASFKRACAKLKIKGKSQYKGEVEQDVNDPRLKIIEKIKKLFSMASSSNIHEAEVAMTKAHELMARYNLNSDFNSCLTDDYISISIGRHGIRHGKEISVLTSILSRFYFVYPVWLPVFIKEKGKAGKVLEITGRRKNVEIASYVYDFVTSYIDSSWVKFKSENIDVKYGKSDFAFGIVRGFYEKLSRISEKIYENSGFSSGLPVAFESDPNLKKYINWYYPGLQSKRASKVKINKNLYDEGLKKGRELVIHKGLNQKSEKSSLLIES